VVILIVLIVAAPVALHRLPLPGDSHRSDSSHMTLALSILSTGELYLEGVAVNRAQLASTLSVEAAAARPPVLEIRSDANTPYEKVADTLALAQRSGLGINILDTSAAR
jgi:biopolymer transport protein ExbD